MSIPHKHSVTIVNAGYRSTNYWVISVGTTRILVDAGWPGMLGQLRANLTRLDVPLSQIRYVLTTHYHIDHAGAAQELKIAGVPLLVMEEQASAIPQMKRWVKAQDNYLEITLHDNETIPCHRSRTLLARLGIEGEVLPTPGHSDDSVSLLLDNGAAFTGDLTTPALIAGEDPDIVMTSWRRLRAHGATTIYPGHGPVRPIAEVLAARAPPTR